MTRLKKVNIPVVFILSWAETPPQSRCPGAARESFVVWSRRGNFGAECLGGIAGGQVQVRGVHLITGLGSALQPGVFAALPPECQCVADSPGLAGRGLRLCTFGKLQTSPG